MPKQDAVINTFKPYWQTKDGIVVKLFLGNVMNVLKQLPEKSVHMCVTSPPYWGLRDYETAEWEGGDESCDHIKPRRGLHLKKGRYESRGGRCSKCGAKCIDQQIGSEDTPEEFVAKMVEVFREVRGVLRDDGTLWLNLGDTYSGGGNLVGIPWRVALALQADGWILRQDIVWAKPSPMPEPVRNRCTKSHEYIFLFAKKSGYFYDAEAIKENMHSFIDTSDRVRKPSGQRGVPGCDPSDANDGMASHVPFVGYGRNKRSVWRVFSSGYSGAHFATFPEELIRPCILAGTSEKGCCAECGAPWKRIVETEGTATRPDKSSKYGNPEDDIRGGSETLRKRVINSSTTVGWQPTCDCNGRFEKQTVEKTSRIVDSAVSEKNQERLDKSYCSNKTTLGAYRNAETHEEVSTGSKTVYTPSIALDDHPVKPCIVLDPFIGSGTSCCVALQEGRHSVGIDLSEVYLKNNAIPRIEGTLCSIPALAHLTGRVAARVDGGKELALQ